MKLRKQWMALSVATLVTTGLADNAAAKPNGITIHSGTDSKAKSIVFLNPLMN